MFKIPWRHFWMTPNFLIYSSIVNGIDNKLLDFLNNTNVTWSFINEAEETFIRGSTCGFDGLGIVFWHEHLQRCLTRVPII